jgi:hypothetical protein
VGCRNSAKRAVIASKSASLQEALAWAIEHSTDPDFDHPVAVTVMGALLPDDYMNSRAVAITSEAVSEALSELIRLKDQYVAGTAQGTVVVSEALKSEHEGPVACPPLEAGVMNTNAVGRLMTLECIDDSDCVDTYEKECIENVRDQFAEDIVNSDVDDPNHLREILGSVPAVSGAIDSIMESIRLAYGSSPALNTGDPDHGGTARIATTEDTDDGNDVADAGTVIDELSVRLTEQAQSTNSVVEPVLTAEIYKPSYDRPSEMFSEDLPTTKIVVVSPAQAKPTTGAHGSINAVSDEVVRPAAATRGQQITKLSAVLASAGNFISRSDEHCWTGLAKIIIDADRMSAESQSSSSKPCVGNALLLCPLLELVAEVAGQQDQHAVILLQEIVDSLPRFAIIHLMSSVVSLFNGLGSLSLESSICADSDIISSLNWLLVGLRLATNWGIFHCSSGTDNPLGTDGGVTVQNVLCQSPLIYSKNTTSFCHEYLSKQPSRYKAIIILWSEKKFDGCMQILASSQCFVQAYTE